MNNLEQEEGVWEAWEAKRGIAEAIVPILKSYKELFLLGKAHCIPDWVVSEGETLNETEMARRWIVYLDAMITSFELELSGEFMTEHKLMEQNKGLQLFAKYYVHMWD